MHVLAQRMMSDAAVHKVFVSSLASLYLLAEEMQRTRHVSILTLLQVEFLFL